MLLVRNRGCLVLKGNIVNLMAEKWISSCRDEHFCQSLENRIRRDLNSRKLEGDLNSRKLEGDLNNGKFEGDLNSRKLEGDLNSRKLEGDQNNGKFEADFHITVSPASEKLKELTVPVESIKIYDLGIGRQVNKLGHVCYYVILQIPVIQAWRQNQKLPAIDFHLTLGFQGSDIHDVPKDLSTLWYGDRNRSYYLQIEKILQESIIPDEKLVMELFQAEYLSGLYYLAKFRVQKTKLEEVYQGLLKESLLDLEKPTWKRLGSDFGEPMLKILNHAIKTKWDKFVRFYSVSLNENGFYFFEYTELPRNFSFVIPDKLAGSSIIKRREHFQILVELGFTDVITVMEHPINQELYLGLPLEYHFFQVEDRTPPNNEQMKDMMRIIDASEGPVLVHCMGGVGRTATVLGAYLMWNLNQSKLETKKVLETRKTILSESQEKFLSDWYGVCHAQYRSQLKIKLPPIIMTVGYPASGKSTFSSAVCEVAPELVHRINQDENGRKQSEHDTMTLSRKKGHTLIIDRCNLTQKERHEWLNLAKNQKAWCIFFDVGIEECRWRIIRRKDHPSIPEGGGLQIIKRVEGSLEIPNLEEGFEKIIVLRKFDEVNNLLVEWGCAMPEDYLSAMEDRLIKFPRTRHVINLGSASRDDLIMSKNEIADFLTQEIYLEEKIDGANMGLSIKDGKICAQNRSHYVNSAYHPQFKYLDKWIYQHSTELWEILEPNVHILYGEWVYAKHSIKYTKLPDMFIVFDLYDRMAEKFWSRERLEKLLAGTSLCLIPLLAKKRVKDELELKEMVKMSSNFYDGPIEGVYLRICDDDWLIKRGKIVRPDFLSGNTHWSKNIMDPNTIIVPKY